MWVSTQRAMSHSRSLRRLRKIRISWFSTSPESRSTKTRRSARRQVVRATSRAAECRVMPGVAQPLKVMLWDSICATKASSLAVRAGVTAWNPSAR